MDNDAAESNGPSDTQQAGLAAPPAMTSRARLVTRILSLAVGLSGAYWLWLAIDGAVRLYELVGLWMPFMLALLALVAALGGFCIYAAYRNLRRPSASAFRWLCATGTVSLCCALFSLIPELLRWLYGPDVHVTYLLPVSVFLVFGLVVYCFVLPRLTHALFPADGSPATRAPVSDWFIVLLAVLVFLDWRFPFESIRSVLPEADILPVIAQILVAVIVYAIGVRVFCVPRRRRNRTADKPDAGRLVSE